MGRYIRIDKIIFNDSHWPTNDRKNGILISSNAFPSAVKYVIKGDSLIILSGNNGLLCFDLENGSVFLQEITEIVDCYRNSS